MVLFLYDKRYFILIRESFAKRSEFFIFLYLNASAPLATGSEYGSIASTVINEFRRRALDQRVELPAADRTLIFEIKHSTTT